MSNSRLTIGVFDSGHGGLSIVKHLNKYFRGHKANICYVGDTRFRPYGMRQPGEISGYSRRLIDFLVQQGANIINIGCNTSSSVLKPKINEIQTKIGIPLVCIVDTAAMEAVGATRKGTIGVMATAATVRSNCYPEIISKIAQNMGEKVRVIQSPCPNLSNQVEKGDFTSSETRNLVGKFVQPLIGKVDTVILGCTHYPFIQGIIQEALGGDVKVIDPALAAARITYYIVMNQLKLKSDELSYNFYFTGKEHEQDEKRFWQDLIGVPFEPVNINIPEDFTSFKTCARPAVENDLPGIAEILKLRDKDFTPPLSTRAGREDLNKFVRDIFNRGKWFVVEKDNMIVGVGYVVKEGGQYRGGSCAVHPQLGKGYGMDITLARIQYVKEQADARSITFHTPSNSPSIPILTGLGAFEIERKGDSRGPGIDEILWKIDLA